MITEIIEYKLKEGADEEQFLIEAHMYHAYFKTTFKGFIDLEFAKGEIFSPRFAWGWCGTMPI